MGLWLEIRCEVFGEGCVSGRNKGPMTMTSHRRPVVLKTLRALEASARRRGWTRIRSGFVCPVCSTRNKLSPPVV